MNRARTVREAAVDICVRVFRKGSYSDVLLQKQAASGHWSRADLALLYELVNGSIRRKRTLEYWLLPVYHGRWQALPVRVQWILIIALYQIRFLDRVPDFAAVSEAVDIACRTGNGRWRGTVNAVLRTLIRTPGRCLYPDEHKNASYLTIRHSFPDWLVERLIREIGYEQTAALCEAANKRPTYGLRVHQGRITVPEAAASVSAAGDSTVRASLLPEFLLTDTPAPALASSLFSTGAISLQDVSAGLASHLLEPKPGMTIIDAAAAPGGKSTHMAELTGDACIVLAMDRNMTRLRKVISYRNRLGIKKVFPILGDGTATFPMHSVDAVLVDAPCSGLGVLSKRAELRWHRKEQEIEQLTAVQYKMILQASAALRPGGTLVYSTCTVLPSENEAIVSRLLNDRSDMVQVSAAGHVPSDTVTEAGFVRTWPHIHGCDGVFAARLTKKE